MYYYYYTRWQFDGDESLEKGIYHTVWTTPQSPSVFLQSVLAQAEGLLEYRRFETAEQMHKFAKSVGLE